MSFVSVKLCPVKLKQVVSYKGDKLLTGVAERQRPCYLECRKVMVKSAPEMGKTQISYQTNFFSIYPP